MTKPITHVRITAADGRMVPFPASEVSAPGGDQLRAVAGKRYRVPFTTYSRKRIASGDVVLVDAAGKPTKDLAAASCPDECHLDETGAIAADEVTAQGSVAPAFDLTDTPRPTRAPKGG